MMFRIFKHRTGCMPYQWWQAMRAPYLQIRLCSCSSQNSPVTTVGNKSSNTRIRISPYISADEEALRAANDVVRRRDADVKAILEFCATRNRPTKPVDPDFTTQILWNKEEEWTEQDLTAAEMRLDRAHQAVDRVERLLREKSVAPIDLNKALEQFVAECSKMTLRRPLKQIERRCGGTDVQKTIMDAFMNSTPGTLQHSIALALRNTSGVGKTFLALSYPAGNTRASYKEKRWSHVCVYTGFNSECPITTDEGELLKTKKDDPDFIGLVVMARVVGQLSVFLAAGCPVRPDDTDLHLFAPNVSSDAFLSCLPSQYGKMTTMLFHYAVRQLCEIRRIHKQRGSTKTTVLVNVDEAQLLDELDKKKELNVEGVGARYALRILRQLQLAVSSVDNSIALLGMSTGINPEVSLRNKTQGTNIPIGRELLSRKEFLELALGYKPTVASPLNIAERVMAAHRFYPRVRDVFDAINRRIPGDISPTIETAESAALLIIYHIKKVPISYSEIPQGFYIIEVRSDLAIIYMDVAVWPSVLGALGKKDETINVSLLPYNMCILPSTFTCYNFEKSAFDVLWFTMKMYFNGSEILKKVGQVFRDEQDYFTDALGLSTSTTLDMKGCQSQLESNEVPHPFTTRKESHLSREFANAVAILKNDGDAVLLYLGKGSSADYMLLRKDCGMIKVWYGDAKTHVGRSNTNPSVTVKTDANDFRDKIDGVHGALLKLIPNLDPTYMCSIITNVPMEVDKSGKITGLPRNVTILCPTTFVCEPWSSILFGDANARDEAEKSKSVTEYNMTLP